MHPEQDVHADNGSVSQTTNGDNNEVPILEDYSSMAGYGYGN